MHESKFITRAIKFLGTKLGRLVAVLVAISLIPGSVIGLAAMGLPVAGIHWFDEVEPPKVKPEVVVVEQASFTDTPAKRVFDQMFGQLDKTWNASPFEVNSAGLPHPLPCVSPSPTLSDSKAYKAGNTDLQVTVAAYPAGLGAEMFNRLKTEVLNCKPDTTTVYGFDRTGVGIEAYTLQVSWSGNFIETTFFRRGDVVGFVATDQGRDSSGLASQVDQILNTLMTPEVCVSQQTSVQDQYRNAFFAGKKFQGKVTDKQLKAKKRARPELTQAEIAKGVKQTKVPARQNPVPVVELPSDDYVYPLWPPLPQEPTYPVFPNAPEKQKLRSQAEVRVQDREGPGCGWAFLSTVEPVYNEAQVNKNNQRIVRDAQAILEADGDRWERDIRKYWLKVWEYERQSAAYRDYSDEVEAVRVAWNKIHAAWNVYYGEYAEWETAVANRDQFIADKEQAKLDYEAAKVTCGVYESDLIYWNTFLQEYPSYVQNDPATWPKVSDVRNNPRLAQLTPPSQGEVVNRPPDPTLPPVVEPVEPVTSCPPVRPSILDEKAPPQPVKPTPPPDPRP